ncbi:MAG: DUF3667 domain-containing protein, partial [Sphingomonadaceae bacterium]
MTGEFEAAANVATGAWVAGAVEGEVGRAGGHGNAQDDGHTHETSCLNCGTPLAGHFCQNCGQAAHLHRSAMALIHDIAHGVFHFEGKMWTTLPLLAWKPGELTRRYIAGERVKFVSPLALFLFSVFLMVAVFSWVGLPIRGTEPTTVEGVTADLTQARKEIAETNDKNATQIAELKAERDALIKAGDNPKAIKQKIADLERDMALTNMMTGRVAEQAGRPGLKVSTGWATLDQGIEKASKNPELLLYKLQSTAYKFSWMLIPISLPFIWLMFAWRWRFGLYDHAIFAIYSLAAMTLLAVTLSFVALALPEAAIITILTFVP